MVIIIIGYIARSLFRIDRPNGGQCGKGEGQNIPALTSHSVDKSFIALPINPKNYFIKKIGSEEQNSPA